jgi:hypothetical protein
MANEEALVTRMASGACKCAVVTYRNNNDGSRDYKLRGKPSCGKCKGAGRAKTCDLCGGCGMLPGSKVCGFCLDSGSVPDRRALEWTTVL